MSLNKRILGCWLYAMGIALACASMVGCEDDCGDKGGEAAVDMDKSEQDDDAGTEEASASTDEPEDGADASSETAGSMAGAANDEDMDSASADDLLVTLADGQVQGDALEGARRFLKIPYAKPPLGALRWQAPQPPESWEGVRHESEFSASCAQLADQGAPASDNEDCLYLNVWAPNPPVEKAPVMMWIHGGGNFSGGAGIPIPQMPDSLWYDGLRFAADHGIVLVTINYRLGPLGFMPHAELADEDQPLGNQGLHDQRMALRWIQQNITHFGGDPNNVTIFGESAGSGDVCFHMFSKESWPLFHRAVSQSGGCTIRSTGPAPTAEASAQPMAQFGEALGCDAGEGQLDCMRDASIADLLANSMQPDPGSPDATIPQWSFRVVIDGEDGFLTDSPSALVDRGEVHTAPYLLGANHDEGSLFVRRLPELTSEQEYRDYLTATYGEEDADAVYQMYPPEAYDGDYNAARQRIAGDERLVCGTTDTARRVAQAGNTVFMYNFKYAWALSPEALGAAHAAEISHVFGAPLLLSPDPDSVELAKQMNSYWASFAKNGDPNFEGAPTEWPEFTADNDERLQLATELEVLSDFRAEECQFWQEFAAERD